MGFEVLFEFVDVFVVEVEFEGNFLVFLLLLLIFIFFGVVEDELLICVVGIDEVVVVCCGLVVMGFELIDWLVLFGVIRVLDFSWRVFEILVLYFLLFIVLDFFNL